MPERSRRNGRARRAAAELTPGSYDVTVEDETGRRCIVRNIALQADAIFSIEERQLTDCGQ
jgi:hypothetical protein